MMRMTFAGARLSASVLLLVSGILSASSLTGCANSAPIAPDVAIAPSAPAASAGTASFDPDFADLRLRAKDKLSIRVVREPDLSLESVRVGEDGFIDVPVAGRVQAQDRTTAEIAADIRDRLGRSYLRNPQVSVNVIEFASLLVTVEGAVAQPGIYQFEPDTTLLGAIAMARGPVRVAKLDQVAVFRTIKGERSVAVFNLSEVRSGRMVDPAILPGDRILIGFSGLSQAWQDFLQTAPLLSVFTRF